MKKTAGTAAAAALAADLPAAFGETAAEVSAGDVRLHSDIAALGDVLVGNPIDTVD